MEEALALATVNLEQLLGADVEDKDYAADLVATKGGSLLDLEAQVVAVLSSRRRLTDMFV